MLNWCLIQIIYLYFYSIRICENALSKDIAEISFGRTKLFSEVISLSGYKISVVRFTAKSIMYNKFLIGTPLFKI